MKKHRLLQAALLIWITALSLLSPAFADSTTPRQPIRPPHIGTDGRLVLPAPQIFPRLPTEVHTFFPNHHAYHYDARLYQEGIGKIGSTEGYTLSGDRAYHEIENILGRTPRWGEWAKDIQEHKAKKSGIQILGQLSKSGPQTTGDYDGYAEFDTYGKNTRANVQYAVFDKLLPLINNYNHLAERLEQTDYLTPQEKARHLDTHLQTQQHPILPSNPQYLKDLTRGITRTRQVREIIGAANQPLSHPLTPEQLTQIGQNAPYLDPSLSYLAHHTQRAEANFAANQQDSWQRWNGESPTPPNLSPYGQQLNRSSGALDHLIGDRSTYLIQRSGLDEAAARAYRNLVPTGIQATVSQGQAAAARFSEDNPDFAAAFGYGTRVAGVAGGVKGIEKALRALPRHPRADGLPRPDNLPPTGRFFRESKLPPVSHDFAEAAEAMFRSRHPEAAPAQSKAAGGNTNKGRMHTGGRERQPESKFRQQHNVPNAEKPETPKSNPTQQSKSDYKRPIESRADPEIVAYYQRRADALRSEFTHPNIREYGNVGIADINIEGVDIKTMAAHSRVHKPNKGFVGDGKTKFDSLKLPSYDKNGDLKDLYDRNKDAEYQLFSNIADKLSNNYQAIGKVDIYTEKPVCASCFGVAQQFKSRYPNITIKIIDGNGIVLTY